jgi:hypothetical protein
VWSSGQDAITAAVELALANSEIMPIPPRVATGLMVSSLQVWLAEWVRSGRAQDPGDLIAAMTERMRWMLTGPA